MAATRRELVAAFLGATAAAACKRVESTAAIPGEFADATLNAGHALRGPPLPRAETDSAVVDALIVGAGAAGLSAGWRLRAAGIDSLLACDVDSTEGGTAQSGRNSVSAFPWGAHYLPAPLDASGPVPRLLREMGVLTGVDDSGRPHFAEDALIHEPEERLFFRGQWYEGLYPRAGANDDDLAQLRRFEEAMRTFARARDGKGRKAFAVPLEAGSDDAEWTQLDRLSMADWLAEQHFTSPRLRWLVDYACRDDYGAEAAAISAWAGIWYFAARQTGDDTNQGYLSWPEGNGRLIRHLAESVGRERLRLEHLVHTVSPVPNSTDWYAHAFDVRTSTPVRLRARQLVLATPRFVAARLVEPWRQSPPDFLSAFHSGPWVVANLTVSTPPTGRGFPLAWDNVLYDSKSLGYVVATHQRLRADTSGPTVLTWYYPASGVDVKAERQRVFSTSCAEWQALALADLRPAHPRLRETVQRIDVMRWGHAMVRPVPGFVWGDARRAAQASLGALHFAHSDLGGLALFEEANHHGVRAAEAALTGLGRTVERWGPR
ncbi:MAG: FAD-dependent oxidoreductase [Archangium sp.]|nr:FAD-dependent oxidoreductase [Archangium sp.]